MRLTKLRLAAAIPAAAIATVLFASTAVASTVQIDDQSNVLNATAVQNVAASLPVPMLIWTTTQDAANASTFDNDVRQRVSSQFPIVMGINTQRHHETLQIGAAARLSQQAAIAAASNANSAFDNVMRTQNNYTNAVVAAAESLRSSLANRSGAASYRARGGGFSLFWAIVLLVVFVIVVVLVARMFFRRPRQNVGPPMGYSGPGYGPGYGPGGPGYGPGPGYGRGGINPGVAGVAGAVGGGLIGYELGKMAGEHEEYRRDEGGYNQGYGDQGGYGGDQGGGWVVGQDSDFGGGGGGDNSGGGGGGGGDW